MQDYTARRRKALESATDKSGGADACWLWTGRRNAGGYGVLKTGELAHRAAWALDRGEEPGGLYVCHSCDNRRCVNPKHLHQNTHKANIGDAIQKGRHTRHDGLLSRRVAAIARRQTRRESWDDANQLDQSDFIGLAVDDGRLRA